MYLYIGNSTYLKNCYFNDEWNVQVRICENVDNVFDLDEFQCDSCLPYIHICNNYNLGFRGIVDYLLTSVYWFID
jgi:hypothetical protein